TVYNNTANGAGGGIWLTAAATISSSIVAGNFNGATPADIGNGQTVAGNNNLFGVAGGYTATGTGNLSGNPMLGALADNGGPTKTRALLSGSPAIDAGNANGFATDQRGK